MQEKLEKFIMAWLGWKKIMVSRHGNAMSKDKANTRKSVHSGYLQSMALPALLWSPALHFVAL